MATLQSRVHTTVLQQSLQFILNMQALILVFPNFLVLDFATLSVPVTILFTKSIKCYVKMVCHTVNCIINKADHVPNSKKIYLHLALLLLKRNKNIYQNDTALVICLQYFSLCLLLYCTIHVSL